MVKGILKDLTREQVGALQAAAHGLITLEAHGLITSELESAHGLIISELEAEVAREREEAEGARAQVRLSTLIPILLS